METLEAITLGVVQGLTEFLPVSSSGHLQIAKALLGVDLQHNVTFDVVLHAATVLSTVVVMWRELWRIVCGVFSRRFNEQQAYVLKIIVSMIPAGVVGVLFDKKIEAAFSSLTVVGTMLLLTAALLAFAHFARPGKKSSISYGNAFIIGVAQAAATMPGLSRSGSTIAAGLLLGNKKESVAQFSFIMVIPVILGKMLLDVASGEMAGMDAEAGAVAAAFAAAFVSGAAACKFMIEAVKRGKLIWFAIYCAAIGLAAIIAN